MTLHLPEPPARPVAEAGVADLTAYLQQIGRVPLLSAADEVRLGTLVRAGAEAEAELATAAADLDVVRARVLRRAVERGRRARDDLVAANLRLVVSVARRTHGSREGLADLVQDGNVGLIRAAEKFDPGYGTKFSTYAVFWIRQAIDRAMAPNEPIRLPQNLRGELQRCRRAELDLAIRLGRRPRFAEIAAEADVPLARVADVLRAGAAPTPLEGTPDGPEPVVATDPAEGPFERAAERARRRDVERAVEALPADQREVVRLRHGFGGDPLPRHAVAARLGLTVRQVKSIEAEAVEALRAGSVAAWRPAGRPA